MLDPCLPFEPANSIDWPATGHGSAASFGRAVVGQFSSTSPTDRDAVIVAGGVAVHARSVAAYKDLDPITFPTLAPLLYVADIAVLPGAGYGGTDALLATDWRGLLLTSFRIRAFLNPVVIEGDDWIDAAPIHVVDANGSGGLDIIGVSADHTQVLVLLANGSGYTESAISKADPILDVVVADWDDDGAREFLVLTTTGLYAHSLSGALEHSVPHAATSGAIASVIWRVGQSVVEERVAWGRPKASGGGELVVLSRPPGPPPGFSIDSSVDLVFDSCEPIAFVPKAIVAGHYTQDDDEDLLLVHEADQTAVVLVNTGTTPHFLGSDSSHDVIPLSFNPGGAGAAGLPALAQVDGLGAEDLVFPVRASGTVEVFLNMDYYRFPPATGGGAPPTSKNVIDDEAIYDAGSTTQLELALEIPQQYRSYEKARLILYEELDGSGVISSALRHEDHWLVVGANGQLEPTQRVTVRHQFLPGPFWSEPRDYYFIDVRFVDDSGALSPHYFAGFTLAESTTPGYPHLLASGLPPLLGFELPPPSPGEIPGSTYIGAYIPMGALPAFANGEKPPIPEVVGGFWGMPYTDNGI